MNLSISEQLAYSTVRIATNTGTGTGFFYRFAAQESGIHVPAIVTNKHVVTGATEGSFLLTLADENGNPRNTEHFSCQFKDFESRWVFHPDKDTDLCAMPIAPILHAMHEQDRKPFYIPVGSEILPSVEFLNNLRLVEDILMVGYPNGLWDQTNNMPLFRKGITSSHPSLDWNGKKEMLIDAACFPGSSGSPVFLFNEGSYVDKQGNTNMGGTRIKLLGILYAGPQHTAEGRIEIVTVPTVDKPLAITGIPNNIGIVIKAEKLKSLDHIFSEKLKQEQ